MRVIQVRPGFGVNTVWLLLLFVFVQQGAGEKRVPLQTKIPEARFHGRAPVKLLKLEPVEKAQPELLVSQGLTNHAQGKPVSGSTRKILRGELAMVTDGSKRDRSRRARPSRGERKTLRVEGECSVGPLMVLPVRPVPRSATLQG